MTSSDEMSLVHSLSRDENSLNGIKVVVVDGNEQALKVSMFDSQLLDVHIGAD